MAWRRLVSGFARIARGRAELLWPSVTTTEDDEPIREVDHTGDDPGPEVLAGPELKPFDRGEL
jgi:hypothetical protein